MASAVDSRRDRDFSPPSGRTRRVAAGSTHDVGSDRLGQRAAPRREVGRDDRADALQQTLRSPPARPVQPRTGGVVIGPAFTTACIRPPSARSAPRPGSEALPARAAAASRSGHALSSRREVVGVADRGELIRAEVSGIRHEPARRSAAFAASGTKSGISARTRVITTSRRGSSTNGLPLFCVVNVSTAEGVQIRIADPAGERLDEYLTGAGLRVRDRVDHQLLVAHDGSSHQDSPFGRAGALGGRRQHHL